MTKFKAKELFSDPFVAAVALENLYRIYATRFVPEAGKPPKQLIVAKAVCKATNIQPSEFSKMSTQDKIALLKSLVPDAGNAQSPAANTQMTRISKTNQSPDVGKKSDGNRAFTIQSDPEFVHERLVACKNVLSQDVETLRQRRVSAKHNLPLYPAFRTESEYLRSFLIIAMTSPKASPKDATPAAWHPYILGYCGILGLKSDFVDRLFQRIVSGDLSDKRACELDADGAFQQLDLAIDRAREQWLAGNEVIGTPTAVKLTKGVALRDAAWILNEEDPAATQATVKRWQNSRSPKLPKTIGVDPDHRQRKLYDLSELLSFIEDCEGLEKASACRKPLKSLLRFSVR